MLGTSTQRVFIELPQTTTFPIQYLHMHTRRVFLSSQRAREKGRTHGFSFLAARALLAVRAA